MIRHRARRRRCSRRATSTCCWTRSTRELKERAPKANARVVDAPPVVRSRPGGPGPDRRVGRGPGRAQGAAWEGPEPGHRAGLGPRRAEFGRGWSRAGTPGSAPPAPAPRRCGAPADFNAASARRNPRFGSCSPQHRAVRVLPSRAARRVPSALVADTGIGVGRDVVDPAIREGRLGERRPRERRSGWRRTTSCGSASPPSSAAAGSREAGRRGARHQGPGRCEELLMEEVSTVGC